MDCLNIEVIKTRILHKNTDFNFFNGVLMKSDDGESTFYVGSELVGGSVCAVSIVAVGGLWVTIMLTVVDRSDNAYLFLNCV